MPGSLSRLPRARCQVPAPDPAAVCWVAVPLPAAFAKTWEANPHLIPVPQARLDPPPGTAALAPARPCPLLFLLEQTA